MKNREDLIDSKLQSLFEEFAPEMCEDSEFVDSMVSRVEEIEKISLIKLIKERERRGIKRAKVAILTAFVIGVLIAAAFIISFSLIPETPLFGPLPQLPSSTPLIILDIYSYISSYFWQIIISLLTIFVTILSLQLLHLKDSSPSLNTMR